MKIFKHDIQFSVKTSESQFIHWFKDNVRPDIFSFKDNRPFIGELNENGFWLQPKTRFFHNSPQSDWGFKELNFAYGTYELNEDRLTFNLTVELERKHRTFFLFGIPIGTVLHFYLDFAPILILGCLGIFGFLLWRVKQDTYFYLELLKNELEKDGL